MHCTLHRVDRVPGFLSSRQNWVRPPPHPRASVASHLVPGGTNSLAERGGGPNSDDWRESLALCLLCAVCAPIYSNRTVQMRELTLWYSSYSIISLRMVAPQGTYRGRAEIGECIRPLSWSVHHNFVLVRDGRYSKRGFGRAARPSQGWANFSIVIECTPESGHCLSLYNLGRGGGCLFYSAVFLVLYTLFRPFSLPHSFGRNL